MKRKKIFIALSLLGGFACILFLCFFSAPSPSFPRASTPPEAFANRKTSLRTADKRIAKHQTLAAEDQYAHSCISEARAKSIRATLAFEPIKHDPTLPADRQILLLKRRLIVPEQKSRLSPSAPLTQTPSSRGTLPWIVMTSKSLKSTWANTLAGVKIHGYLPPRGWLVETTDAGLKALHLHPDVLAVEEYLATDKTHPALEAMAKALSPEERLKLTIRYFDDADSELLKNLLQKENGVALSMTTHDKWCTMNAIAPAATIATLAGSGAVQWLEEAPKFALNNHRATLPDALNVTNLWSKLNLTGEGQIIGHADTGLDSGELSTLHPDLTNAVLKMLAYARASASDENGHGTHTAGSIVGDGSADQGKVKGPAWQAKLVHQSLVDEDGYFCDFNIYTLFSDTLEYGTTIHSDSWGNTINLGIYNSDCQDADLFAWDNPQFLPIFAAGNFGTDNNSDGVIDLGSVVSPSCAKNVISVGACENHHAVGTGGYSSYIWKNFTSSEMNCKYAADPIKSDYVTSSADTENHLRGMAAFSSRGPTTDGRIKPDLIAPGSDIYSCRAGSGSNRASYYAYLCGTSSSTPLVAGCAALIRQYLQEHLSIQQPSAALIKAMLINGAVSLSPGQYGSGIYREIPAVAPNNVEGWGLVNVENSLLPDQISLKVIDNLDADEGAQFEFTIGSSNTTFSATLVWTDYPGVPGGGKMLVNDFDLSLTCPDGTIRYPNSLSSADHTNSVETIRLEAAAAGEYILKIDAHDVPFENSSVALVLSGDFSETAFERTLTTRWVIDEDDTIILKESVSYHLSNETASTETAPTLIWVENEDGETNPYVFCGWELDGERQPNNSSSAINPLSYINMSENRIATARYAYMLSMVFFYGDYFYYTWWNQRYFGGNATFNQLWWSNDTDKDGVVNAFEMFDCTDPRNANDVPTPPAISVNALPVFNTERSPWPVLAEITDNFVVADAGLLWRHKGETTWRRTQMWQLTDTVWGAYLAPTNYGNTRIDYCVCAADWLQYNLYQETTSEVYNVIGDYDEPWPNLTPTNLPTLTMYGESAQIELTLENLAGTDLEWSMSYAALPENGWLTTSSVTSGSIPARGKSTLLFDIDSSKLEVDTVAEATITITHNEPGSETRTFTVKRIPARTRKHGVPIAWLRAHGIEGEDYEGAAESDLDNDGMPTWQEWHADTDPLDRNSSLAFFKIDPTASGCEIAWKGGVVATQYLQQATSLTGIWSTCKTLLPPTAVTNRLSIPRPTSDERLFFRISVPLRGE